MACRECEEKDDGIKKLFQIVELQQMALMTWRDVQLKKITMNEAKAVLNNISARFSKINV